MKKLIILPVLFIFISTFSQTIIVNNSLNGENSTGNGGLGRGIWTKNIENNDIKGTTYLLTNWLNKMIIYTNDKNSYSLNRSNFDLIKSKFVTKFPNDSIFEFDNNNIKYVELNNVIYKRYYFHSADHFLAVLFNGNKISFLKKNIIYVKKGKINPMTHKEMIKDTYAIKNKYFAFINGDLLEIKLNKKDVLSLLKDKRKEIKSFIKKNKISYRKEVDITKLFKHYNSL
ncbi:hypothetical protein [Polaribacter sp. Hel1_85]|uniref:hypothetical protein n=1 Tax=Polaribacter sp. Hel1_85 TaxID=1250005 RepID=UPI00052CDA2F|nr:hypothetical protein [Polaribacter sp. Hel1_85]KGL62867.1 carbamoyl-phosphate synthase small subunit [Polaribacter sp. Hel1_85]